MQLLKTNEIRFCFNYLEEKMNSARFLLISLAFSASPASLSLSHELSTTRLPRLTPRHHLCLSSRINWRLSVQPEVRHALHEQDSQISGVSRVSEFLTPLHTLEQQNCHITSASPSICWCSLPPALALTLALPKSCPGARGGPWPPRGPCIL